MMYALIMGRGIWVVRHGERRDSVDPQWPGVADRVHDPPLTELGRWAGWRTGKYFAQAGFDFDHIFASPYLRTVETATEICQEMNSTAVIEPGLGEHLNPEWFDSKPTRLSIDTLTEQFGPIQQPKEPHVIPEFPEDHQSAMARVAKTTRQILDSTTGDVLIIGHGLTVGGVVHGVDALVEAVDAPLCGITHCSDDSGQWVLQKSGYTEHLNE